MLRMHCVFSTMLFLTLLLDLVPFYNHWATPLISLQDIFIIIIFLVKSSKQKHRSWQDKSGGLKKSAYCTRLGDMSLAPRLHIKVKERVNPTKLSSDFYTAGVVQMYSSPHTHHMPIHNNNTY